MNQRLMAANRSLSKYNLLIGIENVAFTECNKYYVSFAHPSDCRRYKVGSRSSNSQRLINKHVRSAYERATDYQPDDDRQFNFWVTVKRSSATYDMYWRPTGLRDATSVKLDQLYVSFYRATLCVIAVFVMTWCPSVRLSVCLSVTFVHSTQTAEDIVKLICQPGSAIILVFWLPAPIPNSKGNHSAGTQNRRGGKILRFSTQIAVYLGNGTR